MTEKTCTIRKVSNGYVVQAIGETIVCLDLSEVLVCVSKTYGGPQDNLVKKNVEEFSRQSKKDPFADLQDKSEGNKSNGKKKPYLWIGPCPECGHDIIAKKNKKENKWFGGCSQYQKTECRGHLDLTEAQMENIQKQEREYLDNLNRKEAF